MEKQLHKAAVVWTVVGLLGGVFYREFSKFHDWTYPRFTQLSTVHTHALVLGTVFFLLMLVLERVFHVSAQGGKLGTRAFWLWNVGLGITVGMQAIKGSMQVMGNAAADHPAIAGISGLGHIVLAAALAHYFVALGRSLKTQSPKA